MRKKGPIWNDNTQHLIVKSYQEGMLVSDILKLPDVARYRPSEFTIREILKANRIKPTWRRKKQKPRYWKPEIIETAVELRNSGNTIDTVHAGVMQKFPDASISRSTIVRILDEHHDRIKWKGSNSPGNWSQEIIDEVADRYRSGELVRDIARSDLFGDEKVTERAVRSMLKNSGVSLTGRKGTLKRWPPELQTIIVELYQEGSTFEDIKKHPLLREKKPTDYVIRQVLRKHDIETRSGTSYREPISEVRFRKYLQGKASNKDISMIHKHLARIDHGRNRMIQRMQLHWAQTLSRTLPEEPRSGIVAENALNWQRFYQWAIQYLYDDTLKRNLFLLGYRFGMAARRLAQEHQKQDHEAVEETWLMLEEICADMRALAEAVLFRPAKTCTIRLLRGRMKDEIDRTDGLPVRKKQRK